MPTNRLLTYEEIPIPVEMPEDVYDAYKEVERDIRAVLKSDRKAAQNCCPPI